MERWDFSERQAQAILDMQLRRLTGLERDKLTAERDELAARIADYRDILASPERQRAIIREDLADLEKRYTDERRSEIVHEVGDLAMEDLIEDTPCVLTISASGYIKRLPVDTYRVQRRGGRGVTGGGLKDDADHIAQVHLASNHQRLLFFTSNGKVHTRKVYEIPQGSRTSKGKALANVVELEPGETITTTIPVREFRDDRFIFMATRGGTVKKCAGSDFQHIRGSGIRAINLDEGDVLIGAVETTGEDQILLASDDGQACRFQESAVRAMGRAAGGVRGISLEGDARVVSLVRIEREDQEILTICANGYGKRTTVAEYRLTNRGGKGVININTTERNGPVVVSLLVQPGLELLLMTKGGMVVRTRVDDISVVGRAAAGVRVMTMTDGDIITGVAAVEGGEADGEAPAEGAAPAEGPQDSPVSE
jgi:DNA gyrase subunit A